MTNMLDVENAKIGVVGAGSWGTALANLLASKGYKVDHWVFEPEVREQMASERENKIFLPGITLSPNILPSNNLEKVTAGKDLLLLVVPSHLMRGITARMADAVGENTVLVSASKGIENKTHLTMTGIFGETLPGVSENRLAVLSGPSFAKEVAMEVPTAVTVAARDREVAEYVQNVFSTPFFRAYTTDDMIGVELGGAVKNVIALASGVVDGLGLGLDTRAALITRGLAEIRRLGVKMGADPHTFAGLSGVGDLILTCTGDLSRNYTVGKKIGTGMKLSEILDEMRMVAEGVKTARSVYNLSKKLHIELPICHEIYHILYDDHSPREAVFSLMTRELKPELDDFGS